MTNASGVRYEKDGPVATITLCRPSPQNSRTLEPWRDLHDIGRRLTGDVRVVVIRGPEGAFALDGSLATDTGTGAVEEPSAQLAELAQLPDSALEDRLATDQHSVRWLRRPDVVSIAAVRGPVVGGGCQLALACDLRVVSDDTTFSLTEITQGLVPGLGATKHLVELVGYARALELCLTARTVAAAEAYRIGLASVVVPAIDLDAAVADLTAALLAAPRGATSEIKALLSGAATRSLDDHLAAERAAQARLLRDLAGIGE